jgi:Peptidase family M23
VRVVDDLPDCAIGTVDAEHNWGNYVVLYDERGFYVEISHLAQCSMKVIQGDRIARGDFIGCCGNSGYSPQPHIHIQVQLTPEVGAATVPFSFANLTVDRVFCTDATPAQHNILAPIAPHPALAQALTFPLDTELHFRVLCRDRNIGNLTIINRMAIDGSFYFDSGKAKLFYSIDRDCFMCHQLAGADRDLALLAISLPKLPLVHNTGQMWADYLPIGLFTTGFRRGLYLFASSFWPHLASARYLGQWQSASTIMGTIAIPGVAQKLHTTISFDVADRIIQISVGDRVLVRQ